jgi:hypothetical protein
VEAFAFLVRCLAASECESGCAVNLTSHWINQCVNFRRSEPARSWSGVTIQHSPVSVSLNHEAWPVLRSRLLASGPARVVGRQASEKQARENSLCRKQFLHANPSGRRRGSGAHAHEEDDVFYVPTVTYGSPARELPFFAIDQRPQSGRA